jgi:hypothetical protein
LSPDKSLSLPFTLCRPPHRPARGIRFGVSGVPGAP